MKKFLVNYFPTVGQQARIKRLLQVAAIGFGILVLFGFSHRIEAYEGYASYYSNTLHGRPTASGEVYDRDKLTAAHPTLPFGTRVRITSLVNHRTVVVRINDRGPNSGKRIIDVSYKSAEALAMIRAGVAKVRIDILDD